MFKKIMKVVGKTLLTIIVAFLAIALVLTTVSLLQKNTKGAEGVTEASDWMENLEDDTLLSAVNLPGSHDSCTRFVQLSYFSKCQGYGIYDQLDMGYRYLDIRLMDATVDGSETFAMAHGFTNCKKGAFPWSANLYIEDVLEDCYQFLSEHPTETIVFTVKHEHGDWDTAKVETVLASIISQNPDRWLLTDTIPTVGEARGKIVLVRRYADEAGLGAEAGLGGDWASQSGNSDVSLASAALVNDTLTTFVQDRYEYGNADKWAAFNKGIEETQDTDPSDSIVINFLSTKGTLTYGHAYNHARVLNKKLLAMEMDENTRYGWVITDFCNAKLAEKIYSTNF